MSLLDRIHECHNGASLDRFLSLCDDGEQIGWLDGGFAATLAAYPEVFTFGPAGVSLSEQLTNYSTKTKAVSEVVRDLYDKGWFSGWRNELYPVGTNFYSAPFFEIERSAAPRFGIRGYGVHINGFVRRPDGIHLWVGRRAKNKPTYPGLLDNMVAGGLPVGLKPRENVIKESAEEASVPPEISEKAQSVGVITYKHLFEEGLKPDVMFIFDMELPSDFVPRSTDGEMESFQMLPAEEVMEICAETTDFKFNCSVVNIDFFIRHGILTSDNPEYLEIVQGLHG
ncbi:MAG: DUF4743 domain-containing protein [Rhodospirillaceae bacterium]